MAIFFYLFASLITLSSIFVVNSKNPVYAVLWLILAFCNAAGLMILLGAEFISMMLVIIYVGAVAVLLLFVVMMLDINIAVLKQELRKNAFFSSLIALLALADLVIIILLGTGRIYPNEPRGFAEIDNTGNTQAIGEVLYTDFMLPFQISGIILFMAMVACIALTLRHKAGVKRQNKGQQLAKNKENSISLLKVEINRGVEDIQYD